MRGLSAPLISLQMTPREAGLLIWSGVGRLCSLGRINALSPTMWHSRSASARSDTWVMTTQQPHAVGQAWEGWLQSCSAEKDLGAWVNNPMNRWPRRPMASWPASEVKVKLGTWEVRLMVRLGNPDVFSNINDWSTPKNRLLQRILAL